MADLTHAALILHGRYLFLANHHGQIPDATNSSTLVLHSMGAEHRSVGRIYRYRLIAAPARKETHQHTVEGHVMRMLSSGVITPPSVEPVFTSRQAWLAGSQPIYVPIEISNCDVDQRASPAPGSGCAWDQRRGVTW